MDNPYTSLDQWRLDLTQQDSLKHSTSTPSPAGFHAYLLAFAGHKFKHLRFAQGSPLLPQSILTSFRGSLCLSGKHSRTPTDSSSLSSVESRSGDKLPFTDDDLVNITSEELAAASQIVYSRSTAQLFIPSRRRRPLRGQRSSNKSIRVWSGDLSSIPSSRKRTRRTKAFSIPYPSEDTTDTAEVHLSFSPPPLGASTISSGTSLDDFPHIHSSTTTQPNSQTHSPAKEASVSSLPNEKYTPITSSTPHPLTLSTSGFGTLHNTFRRLQSIRKGRSLSSASQSTQNLSNSGPLNSNEAPSVERCGYLPELSFDSTPLSLLIHEDLSPQKPTSFIESVETQIDQTFTPLDTLLENPEHDHPPKFPLRKYEFVNPCELTASPAVSTAYDYSLAGTPLPAPSPSWLSRNTGDLEALVRQSRSVVQRPSPSPLHILSRSLLPIVSQPPSPAQLVVSEFNIESLGTPHSTHSSTKRISFLSVIETQSRPSSIHRLSILQFQHQASASVQSFITCASAAVADEGHSPLKEDPEEVLNQDQPRFLLLLHPPSPEARQQELYPLSVQPSLSPLELFDSNNPFSAQARASLQSIPETPSPQPSPSTHKYKIFVPPRSAYTDTDWFPLPNYLKALAKSFNRNSKEFLSMPQELYGKQTDTVDWGDEVDYSGYEWFKDPPPRPAPPTPPPVTEPYVPQPGVIEQNEMFDFALKSAPNVLYARFKQYGQLGVLAWCSEFGEMIDALKQLGFDGNMFVSTREQALRTCEEILKLDLDVKMQIIVMYLSSQIARLRRFLDTNKQFDDYPKPAFPMDPHVQYS
ncbi:hypothetical protein ABKN59_000803 [Abortiporus biennis]